MEKDDLSLDNYHEKTENLDDILDNINKDLEDLPNDVEILDIKDKIEIHEHLEKTSEYDEEFNDIVKRRDYKGFNNDDIIIPKKKSNNSKRKLKKWVYVILIIVIIGFGFGIYKIVDNNKVARKKEQEKEIIASIKSHYNNYVKVNKDTDLLEKNDNKYNSVGTVYKDVQFELEDVNIDINTKYFKIKDLDYYISYQDVEKEEELVKNDRYKKYLPFNINVVTKNSFVLYDNDEKAIKIDKEMEFPVIINNYDGKYYVEYNNRLLAIKKEDISKTIENKNTDKKNQSRITTLAYHRVYDTSDKCTDVYVCTKKETFDKQMKYLSDNNYFTLNMDELYMYLKGNLQIEKGVVITFDDGYLFKSADEVLDKYNLNGTMFVISGDFKDYSIFSNLKAIDIASHTHSLHKNYVCAGGNQGGAILCAGKDKIVADLKKSIESLNIKPMAFAYPFYDYNETAISALVEAGFKMAFVGRAGVMGRATPKVTNLYKIPRMTVWEETIMSFNAWKGYL